MKLTDLINSIRKGRRYQTNHDVCYSWISCGKNKNHSDPHKALSIRFSARVLEQARYRDGDRVDPIIDEASGNLIFPLGSTGFKLSGRGSQHFKLGHQNAVKDLSAIFPLTDRVIKMNVIKVSTGKIVCSAPASAINQIGNRPITNNQ